MRRARGGGIMGCSQINELELGGDTGGSPRGVTVQPKTKILCTLGPASLNGHVIQALDQRGVDLFRINLSHTPLPVVRSTIELIRRYTTRPICIDTEGAQVRCGKIAPGVVLTKGNRIRLTATEVEGTADVIGLRPDFVFRALRAGTIVHIDWDGASLEVLKVRDGEADAVVLEGGRIHSNRGVALEPSPVLPALTQMDIKSIQVALACGIDHFALSFASRAGDVSDLRTNLVGPSAYVFAKIENRAGLQEMNDIISCSDAIIIDRGDLSRAIPIEVIPMYQKEIIRRCNFLSKPAYVATNLLESMVQNRNPTIAEANDIMNTLIDGTHGLVLAAETAIGENPVASVDMVIRMISAFELYNRLHLPPEQVDSALSGTVDLTTPLISAES
ncbi:MAG: pyruvate kinase [Actinomycetota bacterium]|nr:pyruvate kinase [Actinomycetota bacterium]